MARVVKYPYSGLQGPERELVQLLHEAGRELGAARGRGEVVADLADLGCWALRAQLLADASAEGEYLEVVDRLRGCFAGDEARLRSYLDRLAAALAVLVAAQGRHGDLLGAAAERLGAVNEAIGQFFTPWDVARVMARLSLGDPDAAVAAGGGVVRLCEPAVGYGGMVLAAADVLRGHGLDPGRCLRVQAWDVDGRCARAAWLQFTVAGIPAEVITGDSLRQEVRSRWLTPAALVVAAGEARAAADEDVA